MQMTKEELREHYPNQWLGLRNVVYQEGVDEFASAEVAYTDTSEIALWERLLRQDDGESILIWGTGGPSELLFMPYNDITDELLEALEPPRG